MSITMPRPGSIYRQKQGTPSQTVPTSTGTWFTAIQTDKGSLTPSFASSMQQWTTIFGGRQTYNATQYDAVETFFREGGSQICCSRAVGPGAVVASVNLDDGTVGAPYSLVVSGKGPGAYYNGLRVNVQVPGAGGTAGSYSLSITDTGQTGAPVVEQSPDLMDQPSAVAWSQYSQYVNIVLGTSAVNPIAVVNAALTGGTDDRTNITDAQWRGALTRFTPDLGPGQVTQVGRSTTQAHTDTLLHAKNNNRVAVLDLPDSPSSTTVQAAAMLQRNAIDPADGLAIDTFGGAFGPWVVIPGLTPFSTRVVPPSSVVAARCSFNDAAGISPNQPAAGSPEGELSYVIGLSQPAYDNGTGIAATRDTMYSQGVNQIVYRYGAYEIFGWRTLVDPNGINQDWTGLNNARLRMAIIAQGMAVLEGFILKEIDGNGRLFKKLQGRIQAICGAYYDIGSLYDGGSGKAEDAYVVDTGSDVNTNTTIANKEIHVSVAARMSQDGELAVFDFAKVPITQSLSAA